MAGLPRDLCLLFAQDGAAGAIWSPIMFMLPLVLGLYFLVIRPQQQQERKRRSMIDSLKKNDKVLTSGGIYGTVVSVDNAGDKVLLRIDDERGVRVAFSKSSVARVLESSSEKAAEASS